MKECLKCKIDYKDSSMFCQRCGGKLTEKPVESDNLNEDNSEKFVFCHNCGKKVKHSFAFCPECGESTQINQVTSTDEKDNNKQQRRWLIPGITIVALLCIACVGFMVKAMLDKTGNLKKEDTAEYLLNEIVYEKDDEFYIVDKNGNSIPLTNNHYGAIKEKTKLYYESGIWESDYDECEEYVGQNCSWEQFWNLFKDYFGGSSIRIVQCKKGNKLLYYDEMDGEISQEYDDDVEGMYTDCVFTGAKLYCRPVDNLSAEPILIDTEVSDYEEIGDSCISYEKYGSEEEIIYSLADMKEVSLEEHVDVSYEENEVYVTFKTVYDEEYDEEEDVMDKLYLYKDNEAILIDKEISWFDDSAKEKGIYYYMNDERQLYKYDIKKGKSLIAENVGWISDVFASGEIYYAVATAHTIKMGEIIKNDTADEDLWFMDEDTTYNTYQYFYYNGKKSTELGESLIAAGWSYTELGESLIAAGWNSIEMKEQAATANAYCILKICDTEDLPRVLQSELIESVRCNWELEMEEAMEEDEDSYSNFISYGEWDGVVTLEDAESKINDAFYGLTRNYTLALAVQNGHLFMLKDTLWDNKVCFNVAGTDFGYISEEGLMHGTINNKKVTIECIEDDSDEIIAWGLSGKDLWYSFKTYTEEGELCCDGFYANGDKLDEGLIQLSIRTGNELYYYNYESKKYMLYKDGRLETLGEDIDELMYDNNTEEKSVFYLKGDTLYLYNTDERKEIEIGKDVADYYLLSSGLCFYTKREGEKYNFYFKKENDGDLLIDSQISEVHPISTY